MAPDRSAARLTGDTIFALSSGRPPAAIAVIRISGPKSFEAAELLAGSIPEPRRVALRELRDPSSGALLDNALVLAFRGPASSTGDDIVELHCHGGRAVMDAILDGLASLDGLRAAAPGEFTRRAFANGRIDLTEAEGLADLLEAETQTQRRAALALADGSLKRQISEWQDRVLTLSAAAELAIDYADEEDGSELKHRDDGDLDALCSELEEWLCRPLLEPLKDGLRTVVAGPPNAGKSSLINALSGIDRAIISAEPGTTRDYIEVPIAIAGIAFVLTDTAGLREAADAVEASGVLRAQTLIDDADILLWMGSETDAPTHKRLIQIYPKSDLCGSVRNDGGIPVSAVTGEGLNVLIEGIVAAAAQFMPGESAVVLNRRQAALIADAVCALRNAARATAPEIVAEELRSARHAFDRITGRAGVEDLFDSLFGRFCLGK